jgi:hypothetical protein
LPTQSVEAPIRGLIKLAAGNPGSVITDEVTRTEFSDGKTKIIRAYDAYTIMYKYPEKFNINDATVHYMTERNQVLRDILGSAHDPELLKDLEANLYADDLIKISDSALAEIVEELFKKKD